MSRLSSPRTMPHCERGASALEFALVLPILMVMLLGGMDISHSVYVQSVLQGSVQKAARDSSLENGTLTAQQTAIDNVVKAQLRDLNNGATATTTRRFYRSFTKASQKTPEPFIDSAPPSAFADGICNNNESFTDVNSNGIRDLDGGDAGQGGAKDSVLYTVSISYPRLFPIDKLIGWNGTTTVKAQTILTNQPYSSQSSYGAPGVGHCP